VTFGIRHGTAAAEPTPLRQTHDERHERHSAQDLLRKPTTWQLAEPRAQSRWTLFNGADDHHHVRCRPILLAIGGVKEAVRGVSNARGLERVAGAPSQAPRANSLAFGYHRYRFGCAVPVDGCRSAGMMAQRPMARNDTNSLDGRD